MSERNLSASLREFASAMDADRGHGQSYVTLLMRESATEIERLRALVDELRALTTGDCEAVAPEILARR